MTKKQRLDVMLHQRGLAPSRAKAQGMIMAGDVLVDGQMIDKPGTRLKHDVQLTIKAKPPFVSRGGEKLAGALKTFNVSVDGCICADVGASTGGFTDCLLQNGAARVYAIDVGYGQLAHTLRTDERVIVMERTNARHLETLPEPVNRVVIDASFISLRLLLPAVQKWLMPEAHVIALIKPQFEAGRDDVHKGGIVRDTAVHRRVLTEVLAFATTLDFVISDLMVSPIRGAKSENREFLVWLQWRSHTPSAQDFSALIDRALDAD